MTVRELIQLDVKYRLYVADRAILRMKKLKIGVRLKDTEPSKADFISSILLGKILDANRVLLEGSDVRIPAWTNETDFNKFIAKITMLCQ